MGIVPAVSAYAVPMSPLQRKMLRNLSMIAGVSGGLVAIISGAATLVGDEPPDPIGEIGAGVGLLGVVGVLTLDTDAERET